MIYAIVLPLAVFIGWIVAGDMTKSSFAVLTAIVFVLLLPFLLKFHYQVLIFSWNTFITIFAAEQYYPESTERSEVREAYERYVAESPMQGL